MECTPKLTILTPTYNRRENLPVLFESLKNQTNQNFQWLIIDDGSKDNTKEWFDSLPETDFLKEYRYKENGGKHTALNASHEHILGEYVVIVDSDDTLTEDAVKVILQDWKKYQDDTEVAILTYKRWDKSVQKDMGENFPGDHVKMSLVEAMNNGILGDHCEVARTDCFIQYKFPEYPGERFVGEALMWLNITKGKKIVYIDKTVYIGEYLEGGLTSSGRKMRVRNPLGGMAHAVPFLEPEFRLKLRIKNAFLFLCYGYFAGKKTAEIIKETKQKALLLLCAFPGYLMYLDWKKKYGD